MLSGSSIAGRWSGCCATGRRRRRRQQARLLFGFRQGSYDTQALIEVLNGLGGFFGGAPVSLVWVNLKAHNCQAMRAFVASEDWLQVDYLPACAPELKPVDGLWANQKGGELANRCCQTAEEVIATAQVGMIWVRRDAELPYAFLGHTGPTL